MTIIGHSIMPFDFILSEIMTFTFGGIFYLCTRLNDLLIFKGQYFLAEFWNSGSLNNWPENIKHSGKISKAIRALSHC